MTKHYSVVTRISVTDANQFRLREIATGVTSHDCGSQPGHCCEKTQSPSTVTTLGGDSVAATTYPVAHEHQILVNVGLKGGRVHETENKQKFFREVTMYSRASNAYISNVGRYVSI